MFRHILSYFILHVAWIAIVINYSDAQPMVEVEQGVLMGKSVMFVEHEYINIEREIRVFEGIPFAEPPIRFEYPVKKEAWDGTWNATYIRPSCYQQSLYVTVDQLEISEDCLYLNIFAPSGITNATVMVWVHGGGFSSGSGSQSDYNGEPLSAVGDIIHVNINYRVQTFGYLTTGDSVLPGNYGQMDQIEALRWIQQNIAAFGGNPNKVTIFGESAGSASISYLMLSKLTEGLFSKAIMESGSAVSSWAFQETSQGRDIAFKMGTELGCTATDSTSLRDCLRDATDEELYLAGSAAGFISAPCIDDYFLDNYPVKLLERQDFRRVPLLLGSNEDEGTLMVLGLYPEYAIRAEAPFISKEEMEMVIKYAVGNPLIEDSIFTQYLDWSIQDIADLDYFRPFVNINTDEAFACPTNIDARAHAMAGDPVYLYQMTHKPTVSIFSTSRLNPGWLGTGHAEEISFVFGFPFMRKNNRQMLSDPEKALSVKFMKFWTEFAKTGTPSMSEDPSDEMHWPQFTVPDLDYKVLSMNLTNDRALKSDDCQFWNDLVPKMRSFTADLPEAEREWRLEFYDWKYQAMEDWWQAFNAYQDATADGCDAEGCK